MTSCSATITPEVGDEKLIGYVRWVAVACPDCGKVKWAQRGQTRRPVYTGRCRACYQAAAKDDNRRYFA